MTCPPIKSQLVKNRLCELLYYPGKCSRICNNIYKRWLVESAEVRELEGKELREGVIVDVKT